MNEREQLTDEQRAESDRRANTARSFISNAIYDIDVVFGDECREIVLDTNGRSLAIDLAGITWDRKVGPARGLRNLIRSLAQLVAHSDEETIRELEHWNKVWNHAYRTGQSPNEAVNEIGPWKLVNSNKQNEDLNNGKN